MDGSAKGRVSITCEMRVGRVSLTHTRRHSEIQGQTIDDGVHLDLAEDILKALFKDEMQSTFRHASRELCADDADIEEDRKVLCQVLERLYLPETVDDDKIKTLKLLVHNVFTVCLPYLPPHS